MNTKQQDNLTNLVTPASETCSYQHLYLRGNHQETMFYDKVDMINAWNRLWLSAEATGVQVLSAQILGNHLHFNLLVKDGSQRTNFKHHFRLSITQYHNRRYDIHGMQGMRIFHHGILRDWDDLKDCICYHVRNVLHHGIFRNFLDYPFSTGRYVFGLESPEQQGVFTQENLPDNIARAYLPQRRILPKGWKMTADGLIVPPEGVFRRDLVEALFGTREAYLEALSHRTTREAEDKDAPEKLVTSASHSRILPTLDERVAEYVKENCRIPIPSMNEKQKMEAIFKTIEEYPKVSHKLLTRLFGIPYSTLNYRLLHWRR